MKQEKDKLSGSDVALQTANPKLQQPSMYQVYVLNDDKTTMEFVVDVLMKYFSKSEREATQIMLLVHEQGIGVCGLYTRDVAEAIVMQVINNARQNHFPLNCGMEIA